jgi:hypothetical protein
MDVASELDVVEDGHSLEEFDVLEGSGNAAADHVVRFQGCDIPVLEADSPAVGGIELRDAVNQARLAGTIGANEGKEKTLGDVQVDLVEGLDPTEMERKILDFKQVSVSTHP